MKLLEAVKTLVTWRERRHLRRASLEDQNIRYLYAETACGGIVSGGIRTFIPVFIVRLGASNLLVSQLTSMPAVIVALLSIPAGLFVESQRDLMRVTNWSLFARQICFLLVALIPFLVSSHLAEATVIIWALQAVPTAFMGPAWTTVAAEVIPSNRLPSVNGNRWALVSLVTAVAVAISGHILERLVFPINYQIVFAISFLGGLLSIYFFSLIKLPPSLPLPAKEITTAQRLRAYVRSFAETPIFLRYLLAAFVLRFALGLPAALYSIYWVRHLDASDLWIGWQTMAGQIALIVSYFLWGKVSSRVGHHTVLVACIIGMGFYPVLTGLVSAQVLLPAVALVQGAFITGVNISLFDTLLQVCPAEKRPSFVALNTVFANLAIFSAPMIGSLLADWLDIRQVFFIAGGVHLLAALLFCLFRIEAER